MCAKPGGSKSREKGKRGERSIVNLFKRHGFFAQRILNSEAVGGDPGDVKTSCIDLPIEVKHRERIPKCLWEWLEGKGALAIKRNHYPWLIVMDAEEFVRLLGERGQGADARANDS